MSSELNPLPSCFISFKEDVSHFSLPEKFTFPFYYDPHPLAAIAAEDLQQYIDSQSDWEHNFGIADETGLPIGKMFGVLVVKTKDNRLGYLAAFSGKLADSNEHKGFVPPVFDMLEETGFFKKEEKLIHEITIAIERLENSPELRNLKNTYEILNKQAVKEIEDFREEIRKAKVLRDEKRTTLKMAIPESDHELQLRELDKESVYYNFRLKDLRKYWHIKVNEAQKNLNGFVFQIEKLKKDRSSKSAQLQQKLFDNYTFLNILGEEKSLRSIFEDTVSGKPPSGAGECAAPKLLQYAFEHKLQPIAMAEFWWGASPASEVRKHKQFYPACRGKCEPILGHMLKGIELDDNPMLKNPARGKSLTMVYEDDTLLIVDKPAEFLSVPGKTIEDSVYFRIKSEYPQVSGPLIVHRLDMSTSGLMVIAKNKEAHKVLQKQFLNRKVKKRYVALLEGLLVENKGLIDLPLRLDLDNRPQQLVCYEHGKSAITKWEKMDVIENRTLVNFYPITGRTHQLRVHAAHPKGLNTPIVGDDLYGTKGDRLCLHAAELVFNHPVSKKQMIFESKIRF